VDINEIIFWQNASLNKCCPRHLFGVHVHILKKFHDNNNLPILFSSVHSSNMMLMTRTYGLNKAGKIWQRFDLATSQTVCKVHMRFQQIQRSKSVYATPRRPHW